MFGNLSGPTLLVILFIVLLLFGAPKLPGLAKSLGQSMRILKKEVRSDADDAQDPSGQKGAPATPTATAGPQHPVPGAAHDEPNGAAGGDPEPPAGLVGPAVPKDPEDPEATPKA